MVWVRIDDRMPDNPKVAAAGPLALAMQVAALCYSNRELTDGFVPRSVARRLLDWHAEDGDGRVWRIGRTSGTVGDDVDPQWVIALLLNAGIWRETAGGYAIHDFSDYQPSKAEVEDLAAKRSEAGRRGGLARVAKTVALAKQEPSKGSSKGSSKTLAKSNPGPGPVPEPKKTEGQNLERRMSRKSQQVPPKSRARAREAENRDTQPQPNPENRPDQHERFLQRLKAEGATNGQLADAAAKLAAR